jgi:hypothetical protein
VRGDPHQRGNHWPVRREGMTSMAGDVIMTDDSGC